MEEEDWCIDYSYVIPVNKELQGSISDYVEMDDYEIIKLMIDTNTKIRKYYYDKMYRDVDKYCSIGAFWNEKESMES